MYQMYSSFSFANRSTNSFWSLTMEGGNVLSFSETQGTYAVDGSARRAGGNQQEFPVAGNTGEADIDLLGLPVHFQQPSTSQHFKPPVGLWWRCGCVCMCLCSHAFAHMHILVYKRSCLCTCVRMCVCVCVCVRGGGRDNNFMCSILVILMVKDRSVCVYTVHALELTPLSFIHSRHVGKWRWTIMVLFTVHWQSLLI